MPAGSVVLLRGFVHGMECEAECELLARRLPSNAAVRYSQISILKTDPALPDGNYGVVFDGHFVAAKKTRHLWVTDGEVTRVS